jgi:hypothetical protein
MTIPTRKRFAVSAAAVAALCLLAADAAVADCSEQSWNEFEQQLIAAQSAFAQGDPKPIQALWSHAKDISIFGAAGGHEVGWDRVGPRLAWAATLDPGAEYKHEVLSRVLTKSFALQVQIEHFTHRDAGSTTPTVNRLRVTHVARCEGGAWRLIHRHADRLTATTPGKVR